MRFATYFCRNCERKSAKCSNTTKSFLGLKERVVLVNSFIYSNFDYCPLVWMFSHKKSLNKTESLHKRALRFLLNYYENSYEQLLEKSGKSNMNLQQIRFLGIER